MKLFKFLDKIGASAIAHFNGYFGDGDGVSVFEVPCGTHHFYPEQVNLGCYIYLFFKCPQKVKTIGVKDLGQSGHGETGQFLIGGLVYEFNDRLNGYSI